MRQVKNRHDSYSPVSADAEIAFRWHVHIVSPICKLQVKTGELLRCNALMAYLGWKIAFTVWQAADSWKSTQCSCEQKTRFSVPYFWSLKDFWNKPVQCVKNGSRLQIYVIGVQAHHVCSLWHTESIGECCVVIL